MAVLTYCAGIFWLSSSTSPVEWEPLFPGQDKVVHGIVYAGLAATVLFGLRRSGSASVVVQFWAPLLFVALYGASDEIHQMFVPGRDADVWDWCADVTGAILFQTLVFRRQSSISSS